MVNQIWEMLTLQFCLNKAPFCFLLNFKPDRRAISHEIAELLEITETPSSCSTSLIMGAHFIEVHATNIASTESEQELMSCKIASFIDCGLI